MSKQHLGSLDAVTLDSVDFADAETIDGQPVSFLSDDEEAGPLSPEEMEAMAWDI
jgi:hypothetical protein